MKARLLLFAYALSGTAALVYELAWMRELSTMLGSTAYASGVMLSAFMLGLGLGGLLGVYLVRKVTNALVVASRAELAVAFLSIFAFLGIRFMPGIYFDIIRGSFGVSAFQFLGTQFVIAFIVMVLPTLAMGTTYPLIMKAVGRDERMGSLSGKLYALNTLGGIIGSLIATFVFLPTIGVKGSLLVAAVFSIITAYIIRSLDAKEIDWLGFFKRPDVLVALAILVVIAVIPGRNGSPLGLGQAFYYKSSEAFEASAKDRDVLFDKEGIYSRIQVLQNTDGSLTLSNGALDEGTNNNFDRVTTTMLAAVPAMSTEESSTALVVGLGTGFTSEMYHKLGFDKVTTVEINPDVLPASELFLEKTPGEEEGWEVIVDDARAYILTNETKYDCITSEPSWPWSSGVASLFTEEFIGAAKSRLNPDGVYCQWLPNYLMQPADLAMMYKTMAKVFDRVDVWAVNFPGADNAEILLIGHNSDKGLSIEQSKERIDRLIADFPFNNEFVVPDCITPYPFMSQLTEMAQSEEVPYNTDDHSRLEYRVFWNFVENALRPAWSK